MARIQKHYNSQPSITGPTSRGTTRRRLCRLIAFHNHVSFFWSPFIMTRKSIGLFSMAIACAAAISISASSCDNNPTTPGNSKNNGGVKGPQVLDGDCLSAIGAQDCGVGEARVSYDENGNMQVSNMNESSGINSVFAQPINLWHASIDADFPRSGNGSL